MLANEDIGSSSSSEGTFSEAGGSEAWLVEEEVDYDFEGVGPRAQ